MDALPLVDLFFPNAVEAARMTGEREPETMLRAFQSAGARAVVLKMGERGAAMLVENRLLHLAAPRVNTVETTGAGDCFDAGFLYSAGCVEKVRKNACAWAMRAARCRRGRLRRRRIS